MNSSLNINLDENLAFFLIISLSAYHFCPPYENIPENKVNQKKKFKRGEGRVHALPSRFQIKPTHFFKMRFSELQTPEFFQ